MSNMGIYFLYSPTVNAVKIGYSRNVKKRAVFLQTSFPDRLDVLLLVSGNSRLEAKLHQRFAHIRLKGEWFQYTDELKHFIKTCDISEHIIDEPIEWEMGLIEQ